jgi:gliding motility-associated-like protein
MVPVVTPGGNLNVCAGNPLELTATTGRGVTYEWFKDASSTPVKSGPEVFLSVTSSGQYKVRLTSESGACVTESNIVSVTVSSGTSLNANTPGAGSNSPVCSGNALNLHVNDVGATEYRWRGPGGFSQTSDVNTLARQNFELQHAGLYIVEMVAGTCVAKTDSTLVEAVSIPDFTVSFTGAPNFCSTDSKTLSASPVAGSGFTYQWFETTAGLIPEGINATYLVTGSGEYYLRVTSEHPGCDVKQTTPVMLTALTPPTADFQLPSVVCVGSEAVFTEQSTGDPRSTKVFQWAFGDGNSSSAQHGAHTFSTASNFEVSFTVGYEGVAQCSAMKNKVVNVKTGIAPVINASSPAICEGETSALTISGSFASVSWTGGGNSSNLNVNTPGTYTVITVDNSGCPGSDEIVIEQKAIPEIIVTSDKQSIAAGQSAQLTATGADVYTWSPGKTLSDSTIQNPLAMPVVTTTFTVTGTLMGGCSAQQSVTIQVSGEVIKIVAPLVLSPNGDEINQFWVIEGIENYPDCSLNVFDRQGRNVFREKGYNNDWDATFNGNTLPQGVYYYVFGCPDKKVLTGTVTIVR